MKVPFLDLKVQDENLRKDINFAINNVIDETQFSSGKFGEKFEFQFSKF